MRRNWLISAAMVIAGPLLVLGLTEAVLRVAGVGYPPQFFLETAAGRVTNERFGWRFFPRQIARTPHPESLKEGRGKRIAVVLGESAAMGFPDAAFGLPAFLQAALGSDWRVVNAAMTAINSHVIREIAEEAAALKPTAFILYMGNNEVIGPYGAGSVFGRFSGNLAVIRGQMWVKSWRFGQVMAQILEPPQPQFEEWRGLQFFERSQLAADDPRLERVYHHFAGNLQQIVRAGARAGARVIISTVAVNLKDWPPFASIGGGADRAYRAGRYQEARDLDALRFRADSRINAIIRQIAREEQVTLVDAEKDIEPTRENFWEHVHLKPGANRRLAESIAAALTGQRAKGVLEVTGWDQQRMYRTIRASMERAPFTDAQRQMLEAVPEGDRAAARATLERRVRENPDDLGAAERLAELYAESGDFRASAAVYRSLIERIPLRSWHTGLGEALLRQGRYAEAASAYREAIRLDDRFAAAYTGLGVVCAAQNDLTGAEENLRRALKLEPRLAEAHNSLGRVLQVRNRQADAVAEYEKAIEVKSDFAVARYNLAGVLASLGRVPEAVTQLEAAVASDAGFAAAHYDLGALLAKLGRLDEAIAHDAEAARLMPGNADVLNNWGSALARQNRMEEARRKFEGALVIDSNHAAARRNLELLGAR